MADVFSGKPKPGLKSPSLCTRTDKIPISLTQTNDRSREPARNVGSSLARAPVQAERASALAYMAPSASDALPPGFD